MTCFCRICYILCDADVQELILFLFLWFKCSLNEEPEWAAVSCFNTGTSCWSFNHRHQQEQEAPPALCSYLPPTPASILLCINSLLFHSITLMKQYWYWNETSQQNRLGAMAESLFWLLVLQCVFPSQKDELKQHIHPTFTPVESGHTANLHELWGTYENENLARHTTTRCNSVYLAPVIIADSEFADFPVERNYKISTEIFQLDIFGRSYAKCTTFYISLVVFITSR